MHAGSRRKKPSGSDTAELSLSSFSSKTLRLQIGLALRTHLRHSPKRAGCNGCRSFCINRTRQRSLPRQGQSLHSISIDKHGSPVRAQEVLQKRRGGIHLVLENVADPFNCAAVLRTAEGLGVQHIHVNATTPSGAHQLSNAYSARLFHLASLPYMCAFEQLLDDQESLCKRACARETVQERLCKRTCARANVACLQVIESISEFRLPAEETGAASRGALGNVAMGASRWLSVRRYRHSFDCLEELRRLGVRILASDCPPCESEDGAGLGWETQKARDFSAEPIDQIKFEHGQGVALVLGNERRGVSRALVERSDGAFYLPMCGLTQSFNISVAAAVALYAVLSSGAFPEGSLSEEEQVELMGKWLLRDVKAAKPLLRKGGIEFVDF